MRRQVLSLIAAWAVVSGLAGCGDSPEVEPPVDQQAAVPPQVDQPNLQTPLEDNGPYAIDDQTPSAAHPIAGRSPFPATGEEISQLIPAKRLSEEDQFREPIDPDDIPELVPWTEAKQYVGYEITVAGTIVDTGQSRDGKVNFLNFHRDWRDKFYMVVFDDLAKTLPGSVDATFRGKTLHVTGMVDEHRGRPQIKILSMDQVEFVGE